MAIVVPATPILPGAISAAGGKGGIASGASGSASATELPSAADQRGTLTDVGALQKTPSTIVASSAGQADSAGADPTSPGAQTPRPHGAEPDREIPAELKSAPSDQARQHEPLLQATDYKELSDVKLTSHSLPPEAGMSAALHITPMPAKQNLAESTPGTGQELPTAVAAADLAAAAELSRTRPASARGADLGAEAAFAVSPQSSSDLTTPAVERTPQPAPIEAAHRAIENTTVNLRRMEAGSVSMVLKPDPTLQLALHVKWQQGRLEALAVLERGDLKALGANWSQLQQRLAEQGIRLAPLVTGTEYAASFSNGHSSFPKQQRDLAPAAEPQPPIPARNRATQPAKPTLSTTNPREWWA
jgi:hypothetical protein